MQNNWNIPVGIEYPLSLLVLFVPPALSNDLQAMEEPCKKALGKATLRYHCNSVFIAGEWIHWHIFSKGCGRENCNWKLLLQRFTMKWMQSKTKWKFGKNQWQICRDFLRAEHSFVDSYEYAHMAGCSAKTDMDWKYKIKHKFTYI